MRCGFMRVVRVLCLAVFPLCALQAVGATTSPARAFAGYYVLSNVVEEGNQVHVTMTLTLRNPGTTAVTGGIVAVLSSAPDPVLVGSFSTIKTLPAKGQVTISKTFTISAAEYKNWRSGSPPRLQFLVSSGGSAIAAGIQAYEFVPPAKGTD
jgi:hypothetical protein